MTKVGDVLDEFFSPFSSETLWVMPQSDPYTRIVLKWDAVIASVARAKFVLGSDCTTWAANYMSKPSWKPTMSDAPKPGAFRDFVESPPGTDPKTCEDGFVTYAESKLRRIGSGAFHPGAGVFHPEVQTDSLHICAIGSFNIYTTVDAIDCASKTATMNFWMYNSMSKHSFGKFASEPVFKLCGMKTQYMWWNWVEKVDWTSGTVKTVAAPAAPSNW